MCSRNRNRIFFITIITLAGIIIVLAVCEILLRIKKHRIESSDHLDYGLIVYDRQLGWKLTSNWEGRHKHYDFDVIYSTNSHGFRNDFRSDYVTKQEQEGLRYAFVGDSFTFSFGVNDNETFIQLLNSQENRGSAFYNFGVPGYSTDQEYLLIREKVLHFSPDVILLVVYLGNDLFDNELPFPLQANRAKPYYEIESNGLILRNTPVPTYPKPAEQNQKNLTSVVLGGTYQAKGIINRIVSRIELIKWLKRSVFSPLDYSAQYEYRFEYAIQLFTALTERIRDECAGKKVQITLVLMPGRSFVEKPDSVSAQYQDFLRKRIEENCRKVGVDMIDLAAQLRERYKKSPGKWFYPHEGHLTVEGHSIVSDILLRNLQ